MVSPNLLDNKMGNMAQQEQKDKKKKWIRGATDKGATEPKKTKPKPRSAKEVRKAMYGAKED